MKSDPPERIGRALMSLEVAERSQPEGRYVVTRIQNGSAKLLCDCGKVSFGIWRSIDPQEIVDEGRGAGLDLSNVGAGARAALEVDEPASTWSAWAQLHYDLGAREDSLSDLGVALWYLDISLRDEQAVVRVTDGETIGTAHYTLGPTVYFGLPIQIAEDFVERNPGMRFSPFSSSARTT